MADSKTYLIANHRFRVVGDHEVELLRTMAGFPVFEVEDGDAEWQVVFGCGIERPAQWEDLYDFSRHTTTSWSLTTRLCPRC